MSAWQSEEQRCAVVLREVFVLLGASELARAGAVCRAWRRAAAEPALWRRLLLAGHVGHSNLGTTRDDI
ncbi:hypothetical protein PYW08_001364 [Mythimna loreyi]|uniref:Uncharacterized protein n=1 Tax=Mythimna loreyi TaxID=667449 RepID=A0ACC2R0E5_9NEOP|nr:hypothetical protein PYW08_001364 [Mythimna loreyi]